MEPAAATLHFRVLGPLEIDGPEGRPVALRGSRQRRLVAALVLRPNRPVPVDVLADRLWGESLPDEVAGALQTHVSRLRRLLPDGVLVTAEGGYLLDLDGAVAARVDSVEFDRLVDEALALRPSDPAGAVERFDSALALWRGPALAEFADWDEARAEAARLDERRLLAQEERLDLLLSLGQHDAALIELHALATEHPLRERAQALLLVALYRAGRQADALRAYEAYRRLLADELGLDPSPALRELEQSILDHSLAELAPPVTPTAGPTDEPAAEPEDLPRPANRLIGRADDLAEVTAVAGEHRVVTLSGPGGVGKTRLAMEVARLVAGTGRRVAFCELGRLGQGDEVGPAIATALGIQPVALARPHDVRELTRALRGRELLLVLDNCEHVIDAAAELTERLVRSTDVSVLATSRERLAVEGEWVHALDPLADGAALELFVERAQAVRSAFAPDDDERGDLLYICHRLDGLPLALELAAARTQALSVRAIADALSQRFRLLTGGRRAVARHRSLLEAIRWSFDLLEPDEADLAEVLAVFVGGFTVESAAAVAGLDPVDTAELVARLVERSLVTVMAPGRFGMLESVRQYGLVQLAERAALDTVRLAHSRYFLAYAQDHDRALADPVRSGSALQLIDDELADLRAAHAHLAETGDVEGSADLAVALYWFAIFAFRPEVSAWADADLARMAPDHPRWIDVLCQSAMGRWHEGDVDEAWRRVEEGLARAVPGTWAHRYLMSQRANLLGRTGDVVGTIAALDEALALAGEEDDAILVMLNQFQRLLYGGLAGEPDVISRAAAWAESADASGNAVVRSWAHYTAGEVLAGADPSRARGHLETAVDVGMRCGCWFVAGVAGVTLASLQARHGDRGRAGIEYLHLLDLLRRGALRPVESTMLRAVAELLAEAGHGETAAMLHGAVLASKVAPVFGPDAERQAELAAQLRDRLGDEAFEAAAERGRKLGDDEVLELTATVLGRL